MRTGRAGAFGDVVPAAAAAGAGADGIRPPQPSAPAIEQDPAEAHAPGEKPDDQGPALSQAAFLELGGPGVSVSLNYELRPVSWLGLRAGTSYWPWPTGAVSSRWIPGAILTSSVQLLVGDGPHRLELGSGFTWIGPILPFVAPTLGYRYEAPFGLLLRATALVIVGPAAAQPWAGLSVGYHW